MEVRVGGRAERVLTGARAQREVPERFGSAVVRRALTAIAMVTLSMAVGCGGDDDDDDVITDPTPDNVPPLAITDLRSSTLTSSAITLNWTSPRDDGAAGGAVSEYDLRYAAQPLDANNWQTATRFETARPSEPGITERIVVGGLSPSTVYYFAVASVDDADNRSGVSNFYSVSTQAVADVIPPARITDLAVGVVQAGSVELLWTASGDNGTSGTALGYDILQFDQEITEDNYTEAGGPTTTPIPGPPGTLESAIVEDLKPSTTYFFAIIVWDESRNRSPVSNNVMVTMPIAMR